jgi:hypothetical protein
MKIFNILITILSAIVIYIIFKNYNNKKIEKFTTNCTASLTDWERTQIKPPGQELNDTKWDTLKGEIRKSGKDVISFSFKNDLFSNMDNVLDYTIDINDYLLIKKGDGPTESIEYWKPIKKWKDGVVSHFCKELCILKLGYEWIKTDDITGLIELTNDIGEVKTNKIKELIRSTFISIIPSTYSLSTNEYAKLDTAEFDTIIGSSYINDNNYIIVDGINYKVAANIPIGRKWKVYQSSGSYISSEIDGKLYDINDDNVKYFDDLNATVNVGDIIILTESDYNSFFKNNVINLTEKYVIHPYSASSKVFKPELFEYDKCYLNSCAVFANKEFDDYLKLINLRESTGYKTSSFEHTTEIMNNSDNNLLDLVSKLQEKVNDRTTRGNCSYSLMIDKLIEIIKIGEYVRQDDSTYEGCAKTYDPYTYVKKPRIGNTFSYYDICNDLDVKEYRRKINPEIYKYITTEWIDKDENANYNFEKQWDTIKENINLTSKCGNYLETEKICGNYSLKDKVISKNQLSELILKYLDDVEYYYHETRRKPYCNTYKDGTKTCYGKGIIIKNPNTQQFMDSKNNILEDNDIIEVYADKGGDGYIYKWIEVQETSFSESITPKDIPTNLGNILLGGTREFNEKEWKELNIVITLIRNDIYKYETKYYKYLGLFPRYIKMGKIAPDKYIEITSANIENVGREPNSTNITKTECNDSVINRINENKTKLLDPITELTNTYYDNLLNIERENINTLKQEINSINTDITSNYDNLCSKYDSSDYKLYTKYNLIKFIKNISLNIVNKFDLNELTQKTIKLKEISSNKKNKIFNKQTSIPTEECKGTECRDLGNIIGDGANILTENINIEEIEDNGEKKTINTIIISLNDFSRIVNKVNILENDYLLHNTTTFFKIFEINDDNIIDKIDNDFSKGDYPYPDIFKYTYDDFISINIDLHKIDINNSYYIIVNDIPYELNMDNTFKTFITNYKSIYQQITDINLTKNEKCINNEGQFLFADNDAIIKGKTSCKTDNYSCKENIFEKEYSKTQYENMLLINDENKKSWHDNDYIQDYDDIYKEAVGHDLTPVQLNNKDYNTYSNYWKNKYHNENQCPLYGDGKQTQFNDLYYVNPAYNYGLKWKKLSSGIDISDPNKIIIEIYDYDVLNTSLDSNETIIDFTNSQNNIRFKNAQGNIISMSSITNNHYLRITYINDNGSEFNNYYEVYSTNKCSNSQICSSKSNETNTDDFNKHVENIYSDQEYCNNLNTKYSNRYTPSQKTKFEQMNSFKIDNTTDLELLLYYPNNYDATYNLYEFNSVEQTSAPQ